jgi:predicted CXXCH cytochrome family protein
MTSEGSIGARDPYAGSPYQNARREVRYVGDAACSRCHREIAEAFRSHPMGRSLTPVAKTEYGRPTHAATGLPIEAKGVTYTIEHRDGHVFHKAARRGADGALLAEIEAEVTYALGSGTRGISFLIDRDGFLSLSPIAWFSQLRRWDISPGYGEFNAQLNFERAIQPDCLFCHSDQFRPVAGTLNRYEEPIFRGHAIGCERCHGPGELHVKRGGLSAGPDFTIVNPADLPPALRESVCQQCHLQGKFRFARAGRGSLDFRPGLPLHRFLAVFLMKKGNQGTLEAVGHVEQMEASRCFAATKGQLGCTSCHDPHRLPEPTTKVAYYRERCLECHAKKGCALPLGQRQAQGQGENCIACHMPRPTITNVPHTSATDHRILRRAPAPAAEDARDASSHPGESPLKDYHWALLTEEERRDAARDMGVALGWVARNLRSSPQVAGAAATQALAFLQPTVRERPNDLAARESLGHVLAILDRGNEALREFQAALAIEPRQESALFSTGRVLTRLRQPDLARTLFQQTVAANPWRSEYRVALANASFSSGDWSGAIAGCREAIRLNPELVEARSLLVRSHLRLHELQQADAQFEILLRFYPAGRDVWQQWYDQQKSAIAGGVGPATTTAP